MRLPCTINRPVDRRMPGAAESSYPNCMTADYAEFDDLPIADEQVIRAHATELIAMAQGLGLTNLRYASHNRLVVTLTQDVEPLGEFLFSTRASFLLGYRVRAFTDDLFTKPGVSPDLIAATPL